ncbi:MAG: hypothetical protein P8M11_13035 [Planctomycetota bacterium]|nr:hypothetical protein [Planctomycetota bacterium]MDG1985483.1 hypothetical protein [Planctomycetota bacterium]
MTFGKTKAGSSSALGGGESQAPPVLKETVPLSANIQVLMALDP